MESPEVHQPHGEANAPPTVVLHQSHACHTAEVYSDVRNVRRRKGFRDRPRRRGRIQKLLSATSFSARLFALKIAHKYHE